MAKIGALLDKLTTSLDTSKASEEAAVAANAKATGDREVVVADKKRFASGLVVLGGLAVPRPDGKTEAFYPSTTMPDGYYSEFLAGPDAEIPDEEAPPVDDGGDTPTDETPEPTPADTVIIG